MNKKVLAIGLLTVTTLASFALPIRADEANVQNGDQQVVITGDGNSATQNIDQRNRTNRRGNRDNAGVAQSCGQLSDIQGNDNNTDQNCRQSNSSRSRRNR
jgi:hypothetical protein